MLLAFIKKKKLNNLYNKIIEQSKESCFFKKLEFEDSLNFELFKTNLIFVLWYMKSKKIDEGSLNFIINKFVSDLEAALIESGFGETGLKKEVRKLVKDFYRSLDFNIRIINSSLQDSKESSIKIMIKEEYKNACINFDSLENYYKKNIKLFMELDIKDFWNLNFAFFFD